MAIAVLAFGGLAWDAADACSVDVTGRPYYDVEHDGHTRSNPDGTVYPGDALRYAFEYRFSGGNCISQRVHGVMDGGAVHDTGSDRHSAGNSGTVDGMAEILIPEAVDCLSDAFGGWAIDRGETGSCGSLQMTVSARERTCHTDDLGVTHCITVSRRDTARITPRIMAPITAVNLTERVILDTDLYNATNMDGTSYPWDPIAIEHEIDFMWSSEREGTVRFEYGRNFAPLVEEGGFACDESCEVELRHTEPPAGTGFHTHTRSAENGGGMYVYTAPDKTDAGRASMRYDVTVLNLDRPIATADAAIRKLVVLYEPVYGHYTYTVLNDGKKTPYDDGQAVVLRYGGSMGTGPDDTPGPHADRRSKINAFYPQTVGRSQYAALDDIVIDPGLLTWASAEWRPAGPAGAFLSTGQHAVFRHDGYGIIRFSQELAPYFIEGDAQYGGYENVTTTNLLASDFWAGNNSLILVNYTYQYPHTNLAAWFNMTAYGLTDFGKTRVDWAAPIGVIINPETHTHGRHSDFGEYDDGLIRVWMDDYLWAKAMHDTGDASFADAVANDTYAMAGSGSGAGHISVWMNKTSLLFVDGVADIYADGNGTVLDVPRYYTLDMQDRFTAWMLAGGQFSNITIPWEYDFDYNEVVNTNSGINIAHARLGGDDVWFKTGREFGIVDYVLVDGLPVEFTGDDCSSQCTFSAVPGEAHIEIYNIWGGSASFTLRAADAPPEHVSAEDVLLSDDRRFLILEVAAVAAVSYLIILALKRLRKNIDMRDS